MVASPIEHDDLSTSQLDMTQLSLPESFDESLCLDLYKDFIHPNRRDGCALSKTLQGMERKELGSNAFPTTSLEPTQKGRDNSRNTSTERIFRKSSVEERNDIQRQINKTHQKEIDPTRNEIMTSTGETPQKFEEECIVRTVAEGERIKTQYERDLSRIREDFTLEIASSRAHQNEAFARESKLLYAARDQAMEQSDRLQQELSKLREVHERKDTENSDIIKELESQLSCVRSDLKVKSFELSSLLASHERTNAEVTKSKAELTKCKEAFAQLQTQFSDLQLRSLKLEESNRQKDDLLEVYHHEDLLVDCGATKTNTPETNDSSNNFLCERRYLVKNSVALARKCRELQALMKIQSSELSNEREKNDALSKKLESSQQIFKELSAKKNKNASTYIISTVQARDKEIEKLNTNIKALEGKLKTATQERDDLSTKLWKVLERREQLDEMKLLLETMRRESLTSAPPMHCFNKTHVTKKVESQIALDDDDDEDEDDLLQHTVHHSYLNPHWRKIP